MIRIPEQLRITLREFAWQEGYSAFTASAIGRPRVQKCIVNSFEHHREKTFYDESAEFLRNAGVKFKNLFLTKAPRSRHHYQCRSMRIL